MSTYDVPGAVPAHNDELRMGCWAEHEDGSLILVHSTEGNRVVFSIFDLSKDPPIDYREGMKIDDFKRIFSWDKRKTYNIVDDDKLVPMIKWTWHDKTPFSWEKVIQSGIQDGPRYAGAEHIKSAAARIAESLESKAQEINTRQYEHKVEKTVIGNIADKLQRALRELRK